MSEIEEDLVRSSEERIVCNSISTSLSEETHVVNHGEPARKVKSGITNKCFMVLIVEFVYKINNLDMEQGIFR